MQKVHEVNDLLSSFRKLSL